MIFGTSHSLQSKLSADEIRKKLQGQHFKVHDLDFEVMEREGILKIIPHTELKEEKIYTLPITHLLLDNEGGVTKIKLKSKPRRIDIGGPNIALIFILFITGTGIAIFLADLAKYRMASYILMFLGTFLLLIFFFRMNQGYYDYIRKIKVWVKSNV